MTVHTMLTNVDHPFGCHFPGLLRLARRAPAGSVFHCTDRIRVRIGDFRLSRALMAGKVMPGNTRSAIRHGAVAEVFRKLAAAMTGARDFGFTIVMPPRLE